jgi:hypothetical protein
MSAVFSFDRTSQLALVTKYHETSDSRPRDPPLQQARSKGKRLVPSLRGLRVIALRGTL